MKHKICMYLTGAVLGILLCQIAEYCGVPWYLRLPAYFIMGIVTGAAWNMQSRTTDEIQKHESED